MRLAWTWLLMVSAAASALGQTLTPSRAYAWSSKTGSLLSNWSFENTLQFWQENPISGATLNSHFKAAVDLTSGAKTGSFVAKVSATQSGGAYPSLYSEFFPILPSTTYTLSFYYQTKGTFSGSIRPVVKINADKAQPQIARFTGSDFGASTVWYLYVMNFTTPVAAQYAAVVLAEFAVGSGTLYFDDAVLEEGTLSVSQVQANRLDRSESVAFGDAFGRTVQSQAKATRAGDTYLVAGSGFDSFARPESTYLATPYALTAPAFQSALLSNAQTFYSATGPFKTHNYPFSRVQYAAEVGARVVEASGPDSAWQIGKGHTVRQGFYFVNDTAAPANIENPSANPAECQYRLDWSKDQDSSYALTWTNVIGQVIRTARNVTRSASGANTWKWAGTRSEYFPTGGVRKSYTPLDDSGGTSNFAEYYQYDSRGTSISAFSPDRNLKKAWYNRSNQIRYSQDEEQRSAGEYTYFDYDDQGRLLSQGVLILAAPPSQDSADVDAAYKSAELEEIGYIYDDTASFQARTGLTLQAVLGSWQNYVKLDNAPHRLFCKYHRNQDNTLSQYGPMDRFVADFFSYDNLGNVLVQWKFMGPVRDPALRLQDMWYTYDSQNRMLSYKNYTSASQLAVADSQSYTRDFLGRVDSITGIGGKHLANYAYANYGPLQTVTLGGTASGDSATAVDFFHTSQGGLAEIQATAHYGGAIRRVFQQFLGYENNAFGGAGAPSLYAPRFNGTITQQLYKYTSDMGASHPIRAVNYNYDLLGRMGSADAYWNTGTAPFNANEDIAGTLSMGATDSLSSRFNYDLNGRIKGQRSGGVASVDSAIYTYTNNSYELDHVNGKLSLNGNRNLSALGSLVYDGNGALIQDKSKKMNVQYGWDGLPVVYSVDSVSAMGVARCCAPGPDLQPYPFRIAHPSVESHNFYDADGNRVTRVQTEARPLLKLNAVYYLYMGVGMVKQWTEEYALSGLVKTSNTEVSLLGQSGMIGRIKADGKYEFFIKNHLGSTMRTVDDRGRYVNIDERVYDYLAYGPKRDLKVGSANAEVTQKFTGKELEQLTGLYAFGARWQDPELGMWMSPDPAGQFFNPYSYVGGDVLNAIDPTGMYSWTKFWRQTGNVASDVGDFAGHETMEYGRAWRDDPWKTALFTTLVVGGTAIGAGVLAEGIGTVAFGVSVNGVMVASATLEVGSGITVAALGGSATYAFANSSSGQSSSNDKSGNNPDKSDAEKVLDSQLKYQNDEDSPETSPAGDSYVGGSILRVPTSAYEPYSAPSVVMAGSSEAAHQSPLDIAMKWDKTCIYKHCNEVVYNAVRQAGYSGPYFNTTTFPGAQPTTGMHFVQRDAGADPQRGDILVWRGHHMNFSTGGDRNFGWRTSDQISEAGINSYWAGKPEVWQIVY